MVSAGLKFNTILMVAVPSMLKQWLPDRAVVECIVNQTNKSDFD